MTLVTRCACPGLTENQKGWLSLLLAVMSLTKSAHLAASSPAFGSVSESDM